MEPSAAIDHCKTNAFYGFMIQRATRFIVKPMVFSGFSLVALQFWSPMRGTRKWFFNDFHFFQWFSLNFQCSPRDFSMGGGPGELPPPWKSHPRDFSMGGGGPQGTSPPHRKVTWVPLLWGGSSSGPPPHRKDTWATLEIEWKSLKKWKSLKNHLFCNVLESGKFRVPLINDQNWRANKEKHKKTIGFTMNLVARDIVEP